jgi:hypothetical protein
MATTPAGFKVYQPSGKGFSVALPPNWTTVSPSTLQGTGSALDNDPKLKPLVQRFRAELDSGIFSIIAIDTSHAALARMGRTGRSTHVLIASHPSIGFTADQLSQVAAASAKNTLRSAFSSTAPFPLEGGSAAVTTITGTIPLSNTPIFEWMLVAVHQQTTVDVVLVSSTSGGYQAAFYAIARSVRFV